MGPLPTPSKGYQYILVVTNVFSKWVEAFPFHATDSETLAKFLVDEGVCPYGVSVCLRSNQGANLNSQVILSLCRHVGIDHARTTAYHSQGNGQVERFNPTLESMLQLYQKWWMKTKRIGMSISPMHYLLTVQPSVTYLFMWTLVALPLY